MGSFKMETRKRRRHSDFDWSGEKILAKRKSDGQHSLEDFAVRATLGEGGFGKVELVKSKQGAKFYARKKLAKKHIHSTDLELETKIMQNEEMNNFIVKLWFTLKDAKYVYMFMEACLGGELWLNLKANKRFSENRAQFYTACIIEAIQFLHDRKIVYRDIKPENILVDKLGFAKLADFGLARYVHSGKKRFTCCGTPEYMAPEVFLKGGHDLSVDYWAIGVLIYELTSGNAPFNGPQESIRGQIKAYPSKLSKHGREIIKNLIQVNPSKRLGNFKNGMDDIKHHRWFQSFDWLGLQQRNMTPPWVPTLNSEWDTKYFNAKELTAFKNSVRVTRL